MAADRRVEIATLRARGDEAMARGDTAGALHRWNAAIRLVLDQLASGSAVSDDHTMLGNLCYSAGEALIQRNDAGGAVPVLQRAILAYRQVGPEAIDRDQVDALVADVRLRLAKAHAIRGWAASALAEAQAGLLTYHDRWSGRSDDPVALHVARALAWQGFVTMLVGDPDIAAAAFHTSITIQLANAEAIDADPGLAHLHRNQLRSAAASSYDLAMAQGRHERAAERLALLRWLDPAEAAAVERYVAGRPPPELITLGAALDEAGAADARDRLVAPAEPAGILTSAHRGEPDRVVLSALTLLGALKDVAGSRPDAARRIALEIHTMLAHPPASSWRIASTPGTRPFAWASALLTGGRLAERASDDALAADVHGWLQRLALQLDGLAATDEQVADTLADVRHWIAGRATPLAFG